MTQISSFLYSSSSPLRRFRLTQTDKLIPAIKAQFPSSNTHFQFREKKIMAFPTLLFSSSPNLYLKNPKRPNFSTQQQSIRCSSSSSLSTTTSPKTSSKQIQFDLKTYWITLIKEINHELEKAIPVKYPEQIYESMRYSVLAEGAKRAPPVMCVASTELFGVSRRAAFPTACALEMVHAASLIHDDLPCMDDDLSRRGRPTNHAIFGVDLAILAGDALFPLGFQHIVTNTPSDLVPESRILRVIGEFARAVGSTGMAAGQLLDLTTSGGEKNLVEYVQEKKFGEMAECSAACGGIIAGAEEEEVARLRRYGRAVGVLYQVVDDVLEAKQNREKKGEERESENSYVGVYGIDRALEMVEELRVKAKKELDGFEKYGEKVAPLYSFVDYAVERGFALGEQVDDEIVAIDIQDDCIAAL